MRLDKEICSFLLFNGWTQSSIARTAQVSRQRVGQVIHYDRPRRYHFKQSLCEHTTVTQTANQLEVHRNTILYWIKSGKFQAYRVGHKWYLPINETVEQIKDKL